MAFDFKADEKEAFEALWVRADADKDGSVGVNDARQFYGQFGLSAAVLGEVCAVAGLPCLTKKQIWTEANSKKTPALSQHDFYCSLR
jgi:hypothetical protein